MFVLKEVMSEKVEFFYHLRNLDHRMINTVTDPWLILALRFTIR